MLDEKDRRILEILEQEADSSTYTIAKKTGIPQTTVLNRMRKMKEAGIIRSYTIDIDWRVIGMSNRALIFAKVDKNVEQMKGKVGEIEHGISKLPSVVSVKRLMGAHDFVIEVVCKDVDELNDFLVGALRSMPEIADTETVMVLRSWKGAPLSHLA